MKAEIDQQRTLLTLADVDAELRRIAHRAANLTEQQEVDRLQEQHRVANDQLAVVGIALEDLDGEISKLESEIESVRQREERDRGLLAGGTVNPKQLSELQHELETLERRQASLEDSLLEVMERREALQAQQSEELARIDQLQNELSAAQRARDEAQAEIDSAREGCGVRRSGLAGSLAPELLALYEKQAERGGIGAGLLQGRRCGACRIEIDRGEMARISAAEPDDVLRCPECGAILLRLKS
ncbi:C4-type zinc ribbon domain-containing protein [Mycobacterium sp. AMU20-3851]|uniref:zinc ribbon domain-containing protein n=1 Tax=Mycobacterium sp. AMU20-3851 TaxID=3122055 RepID=UPI0037544D09